MAAVAEHFQRHHQADWLTSPGALRGVMPAASKPGFLKIERDQPQIVVTANRGESAPDFKQDGQSGTIVVGAGAIGNRIVVSPDDDQLALLFSLSRQVQYQVFMNGALKEEGLDAYRFTDGCELVNKPLLYAGMALGVGTGAARFGQGLHVSPQAFSPWLH